MTEEEECKESESFRKKIHLADDGAAGGMGLPAKGQDSSLCDESTAHKEGVWEGVSHVQTGEILTTSPLKEKYAPFLP